MAMTAAKRIKIACIYADVTNTELADSLGMLPQGLKQKLKYEKITFEEHKKITEALGCKFYTAFRFKSNINIVADSANDMIKYALNYANINASDFAERMGVSRQNIAYRLKNGKFPEEELHHIANLIGAEYIIYYEFPDGQRF